jgi:hypothetical protein
MDKAAAQIQLQKELSLRKFDESSKREPDKIYFIIENEVIGTTGNFIAFTGLPKSGKTTFLSACIASAICGEYVFNMRLFTYKKKIAYFDTEQSPYDFNRTLNRIKQFADKPNTSKILDCFLLREDEPKNILALIYFYLKNNVCDIVVIDGLLDLLNNMNDEGEAKRIIRILKRWGKLFDILIITVLHQGKKDLSSIGHIGSSVDRYAQSVLEIVKEKDGTLTLKNKLLRSSGGFNDINIYFNNGSKRYEKNSL